MFAPRSESLVGLLLLLSACASDSIGVRQTQGAAGAPPQPPAAGARSDVLLPGLPDAGNTLVVLPDDDGGTLTLPSSEAKKPPADPNIEFDWTESQPSAASCEPGEYLGTFSCVFTFNDELAALFGGMPLLEGEVRLTLARSMNGEFLEVADGRFDARAASVIGASALLNGKLDCRSRRFVATLTDGVWAYGDPAMPLFPGGVLAGDIIGMYQDDVLSGEWKLGDPMQGDCVGTWTVSLTP